MASVSKTDPAVGGPPTMASYAIHAATVSALILLSMTPLLWRFGRDLWVRAHYQFFPFVLAGVAFLVFQRWPRDEASLPKAVAGHVGLAVLCVGLGLYAVAVALFSHWLMGLACAVTVCGLLIRFAGFRMLSVALLLFILIPPPLDQETQLIQWMQLKTTSVSSVILDVVGVKHLREGTIIEVPGKRLFIEEACSGNRSLLSLLACTALYVVWNKRPVLRSAMLLASVFFWCGLANSLRIISIALSYAWTGVDLSVGWQHEALGLAVFVLAFALVGCTDQLLLFLIGPIPPEVRSPMKHDRNPLSKWWNLLVGGPSLFTSATGDDDQIEEATTGSEKPAPKPWPLISWSLASFALILGGLQLFVMAMPADLQRGTRNVAIREDISLLNEAALPEQSGIWKRTAYKQEHRPASNNFGEYSKIWFFRAGSDEAQVSLDYPFFVWHDLTKCYQQTGWTIIDRQVIESPAKNDDWPCVVLTMAKPTGEFGYVIFSQFEESGQPVPPPEVGILPALIDRMSAGPLPGLLGAQSSWRYLGETIYQFQIFVPSPQSLTKEQQQDIFNQYLRLRSTLAGPR